MKSIYYKSKWSQSTPTNFHQIFNLIERVGLALLICWISAGAAAQAVNQPTNFLLAQREKENLVCGCCPCRRPEAVGAPLVAFFLPPPHEFNQLISLINFIHCCRRKQLRSLSALPPIDLLISRCSIKINGASSLTQSSFNSINSIPQQVDSFH